MFKSSLGSHENFFYQKQWNFNGELKTRIATENRTRDDNTMMKYESVNV